MMRSSGHLAFERLVHSDWSSNAPKRWSARALRRQGGWLVERVAQTPSSDAFLDELFGHAKPTLAGFDFPIGLPLAWLGRIGAGFREFVCSPQAQHFLQPADTLFRISPLQPFYRKHPAGGRRADLLRALECSTFDQLLRDCDRPTSCRSRAESIFWTVGAKQVGKAALAGWQDILIPALERGAALWPFDGMLAALQGPALTIAETYPAEAYQHIGMRRTIGKRTQTGRREGCAAMFAWAARHGIQFSSDVEEKLHDGFGPRKDGEDPFDALAGLCGMIEVVDGRRAEAPVTAPLSFPREGWILGQIDLPCA
ncbi:DUF429 domain-containing protein [Bradyrhizobium sp. SZCCHNS2096]|uniref:DUF429 domain-containing protein n=1 Tax=Bradyrhizobium sp. SZCCHNS2096 TaxID=3057309 RepID=UPI00291676CF|nr:DUF429 domain-containing protein [Bradyrhizobium sp. SZCCHNS2096]